jgi:hypothetical protein
MMELFGERTMTQLHTATIRLVSGQRLEGAPPGVAVLTPPLHHAREQKGETFAMVLGLREDTPSRLYREGREVAAQTFWSTAGGVTAALRYAMIAVNRFLLQHGLQGTLSCAALRGGELFLVQAGPTCAYVLWGGELEQYPKEELPPLGTGTHAEVRLAYLAVGRGNTLVLASKRLDLLASDDALRRILSLDEVDAVLDGLEQIAAGETLTALVVRWSEERAATIPPLRRRRAAPSPARVPASASPAAQEQPLPEASPPPPAPPEGEAAVGERATRLWDVSEEEEWPEIPTWETAPEPVSAVHRPSRPPLAQRLRLGDRLRGAGRRAGVVGSGLLTLFRRALPGQDAVAQTQPGRKRRPPPPENPRVLSGVALAILVVVALVTLLAWINQGSAARHQQVLAQAQQHATQAEQATDPEEERSHWEKVLSTLAGEEAPAADALQAQAQEALDRLDGVIRVEPTLLWEFDSDISARRLVAHGPNLFLLDADRRTVFQLSLSETGEEVVGETAPAILHAGEEWGGQRVGDLIDMAWNQPGGEWATDALVALDADNRLWVYDPAWIDNTYPLFLGPASGEGIPVAMAAFEGRLYLFDPQANQVWRYWSRDGGYPDRAEPYFPTGAPQSLALGCDLAIDGNVYVLTEDSQVLKYFECEPASFEVAGVPAPPPRFVALAVDPGLADGPVYLADDAAERVVVLNSRGGLYAQLRAAPGNFSGLQALTLDDTGNRLFILAGGRLYVVPLGGFP